jgi:hypothetical protein
MLFDLFHGGRLEVGGQTIRLEALVLPAGVRRDDHIEWTFPEPVKVETPGPNSRLSAVRQYRDRVEFTVHPWAVVRIDFE